MKFDLKGHITTLTDAADKNFLRGNSCLPSLSYPPLPSPFLTLYLCLSIFSPSLVLLLSFFFFFPPYPYIRLISTLCLSIFSLFLILFFPSPPLNPTLALYPPYASLSFLSPSFFFSLFLTLTYFLMDNFLSLFIIKPSFCSFDLHKIILQRPKKILRYLRPL